MADTTVNLQMPYVLPSQAQKHVTHNEALQRLDAVTQLVLQAELAAPPVSVAEGACYAIKAPAAGDWSGRSGQLAFRQDGAWIFMVPGKAGRPGLSIGRSRPCLLTALGRLRRCRCRTNWC